MCLDFFVLEQKPLNVANRVAYLCMHVRTHAYTDRISDRLIDTDKYFNTRVYVSALGGVDLAKLWKRTFKNKAGFVRQQFVVVRSGVDLLAQPRNAGLQPELRSFFTA